MELEPEITLEKQAKQEKQFVVEYCLPYMHTVMVGVKATDAIAARDKAAKAFEHGVIWDDSEEMPLLMDDFDECGDVDEELVFRVVEVDRYPPPTGSALASKRRDISLEMCETLLGFLKVIKPMIQRVNQELYSDDPTRIAGVEECSEWIGVLSQLAIQAAKQLAFTESSWHKYLSCVATQLEPQVRRCVMQGISLPTAIEDALSQSDKPFEWEIETKHLKPFFNKLK